MSDLLECKKIWQGSKNILDERYNGTKTLRLCKDPLFLSLSLSHTRTHAHSLTLFRKAFANQPVF